MYPYSASPLRTLSRNLAECCIVVVTKPITGMACCCACAANGHAAATPPISLIKSRRFMATRSSRLMRRSKRIDVIQDGDLAQQHPADNVADLDMLGEDRGRPGRARRQAA